MPFKTPFSCRAPPNSPVLFSAERPFNTSTPVHAPIAMWAGPVTTLAVWHPPVIDASRVQPFQDSARALQRKFSNGFVAYPQYRSSKNALQRRHEDSPYPKRRMFPFSSYVREIFD